MIIGNHASFTIYSELRTAAEITAVLGIEPSEAHERGDKRMARSGGPVKHPPFEYDFAVWDLSADDAGQTDDRSGTTSLAAVLAPLSERTSQLDTLRADCEFRLSWYGTSDSSQGGLVIPDELLAQIAALRCHLYMTAYWDGDDVEDL